MNDAYVKQKAEDVLDPEAHFEIWPFNTGSGCPVSDINEPHLHDFFVVHLVTSGSGVHVIDFKPYDILPDTLYFVSPHQLHLWRPDSELTGFVMAFSEEFLRSPDSPFASIFDLDFFHTLVRTPMLRPSQEQAVELGFMLEKISDEFQAKQAGHMAVLQSYFRIFMVNIQRLYSDALGAMHVDPEPDLVRRFKKLVSDKYASQAPLQEYADELGVSTSRLSAVVKEVTGQTPGHIMRTELVLAAKRMLAHSEMNVSEICFELNFEDPSYFGRFFKREAGATPTAFREQMREKYQHFAR